MNETQLCAIEQSIRDEHHSELRWPHYVLLDLIAEIRRLRAECDETRQQSFVRGAKSMRTEIGNHLWQYYEMSQKNPELLDGPNRIRELVEWVNIVRIPEDK